MRKLVFLPFIAFLIVLAGFAAFFAGFVLKFHPLLSFNSSQVPLITANPVEMNQIFAISYFRSDAGHDYSVNSWDGETCRSMKHYFDWSQNMTDNYTLPVRSQPTPGHPNIDIYAPFNGTITEIDSEKVDIGIQVHIASDQNPAFYVRLFHIDLLPGFKVGSHVISGEEIGKIGPMDGLDVSYEAMMINGKTVYLSIFDYMTSQAFAPYAALGFKPGDFILSRSQADALNYTCNGEQFVRPPDFYSNKTKSQFEGYLQFRPNPYAYLYNYSQGV